MVVVNFNLSEFDSLQRILTFNWSIDSPVFLVRDCSLRSVIDYNILASNCGSCPTTTNHTTVTCTDVPTDDWIYEFQVQTLFCGMITINSAITKSSILHNSASILEGILMSTMVIMFIR